LRLHLPQHLLCSDPSGFSRTAAAEGMLGDEVQDHLPAHGHEPQDTRQAPEWDEAVLRRDAVAGVQRGESRLGGQVLGHVGCLASGLTLIVQPGGTHGHQLRGLDVDPGCCQGMGHTLVSADRHVPHNAVACVVGSPGECVAPHPDQRPGTP